MRRLFVLLALGILWAGCGGGDDDAELVSRLPGDARALGVIDLAVVKERLGLPEDEVVMKVEGEASTDRVEDPSADTSGPFEPGDAEADGDIARLPLTYRPFPGPTPIRVLTVTLFQPYRCSGD